MIVKRNPKNNIIFLGLAVILFITGCQPVKVNLRKKDYTEYDIKVEEKKINTEKPANVIYHTDGQPISNKTSKSAIKDIPIKGDDKVSISDAKGATQIFTYDELAKKISENLVFNFEDYRMKEVLNYNYSQYSELNLNGIYINEEVDTVRKADQYYRDDKRLVGKKSFYRKIEALKYRNKAENDVIKGIFTTRERNKDVNLEWNHIEYDTDSEDIKRFIDTKELNFINIHTFYKFDDMNNYKAQGTATLRDFLSWNTLKNTGINTLRDDEIEVTREVIEKGVTTEKKQKMKPLNAQLEFVIEVKTDENGEVTIDLQTDLTSALKLYYKVYEKYDIINADYNLHIVRYPTLEEMEVEDETEETNEEVTE